MAVKLNLIFRDSDGKVYKLQHDDTIVAKDNVDQYGHLSCFRIGGLLVRICSPFKQIRLTYRGFLNDVQSNKLVFARFNLQWMCLTKVFDFQKNFSKDFLLKEFASKGNWTFDLMKCISLFTIDSSDRSKQSEISKQIWAMGTNEGHSSDWRGSIESCVLVGTQVEVLWWTYQWRCSILWIQL